MAKNIYRERMEQLKISEAETLKLKLRDFEAELIASRRENATLRERLRLVKIAATEGE